ncbi:hypothetical protein M406DRAFT_62319 [Cryphonectria parasitica EP155]|uniref:Uncharacterized protein n=1 Tax=Cryphonectria parasitica (strain ATCC 38755 / EP155) TaxID=660469 RepID=A0A9P5CP20_CRYP1|nr:uncharacterized protein M406DRAFT_62319 [Cryphonectria parasitica EP155]KAF3764525.1 hypothetical protein M406DRAFT_62319 [Cryphonectria parasitica EP155]
MQLHTALSAIVAAVFFGSIAHASPMPCPDVIRDQILLGLLEPEACCSYGICKGDVNVQGG